LGRSLELEIEHDPEASTSMARAKPFPVFLIALAGLPPDAGEEAVRDGSHRSWQSFAENF
jgi:hypothetical protein